MAGGREQIEWNDMENIFHNQQVVSKYIFKYIMYYYIVFCTGTKNGQLIHEAVENKLYFTTESRVETYELESGVRTTVVNGSATTTGVAVDQISR